MELRPGAVLNVGFDVQQRHHVPGVRGGGSRRERQREPRLEVERDILPQMGFRPPIAEPVREMAPELSGEERLPARLFAGFAGE